MPIYEYACEACGTFEVTQRITDKPLRRCPTCKGKVHKLISTTSFQLKGSGWYVTDYAGKDGAKKGTEEGQADSTATKDSKEAKDAKDAKDAAPSKGEKTEKTHSKKTESKREAKSEATAA